MTISCDPGTTLRRLNEIATASGYMLPALPFYLELTIGGVLSAGGIGSGSHQHGLLVSNVAELEVLKADGSIVTCTPAVNQEVFNGVLGTSGRFGIITKARLKLIESKEIFRTLRLVYKNIDQWLNDYHFLLTKDISNLQGICVRSKEDPAIWNFLLEVTLQAENEEGLRQYKEMISKLTFNTQLNSSDFTTIEFLDRYKDRFEQMRQQGAFAQFHPILEFIISADKAKEIVEKALQLLPPAYEDGFRLIYFSKKNLPPYVMIPEAEQLCMFAVLPTGIAEEHLEECFDAAQTLHEYARALHAKRYLSGWVGMMDSQEFKNHYGGKAAQLAALKKKMDPGNLFKSLFAERFYGWS
jgi:FAD/FMN-containing dehydrogenase